jgi:thiamine-monophosphate kinase
MRIQEIGGEFALIQRLGRIIPCRREDVLVGIGDDAAVLKINDKDGRYVLVTTDTVVENDHFNPSWSRPEQIGIKAAESNISDIAAMGGRPTYMFISLVLPPDTAVEWTEDLYKGIAQSCERHRVAVVGGDTTHGAVKVISITLMGEVTPENLCLRSHAKPGDMIAVTGSLGASAAGLNLVLQNLPATPYLLERHLAPRCRLGAAQKLAPVVNAMIDISDGLASEVNHICTRSNVGASVAAKDVPLHPDVIAAAYRLGMSPLEFALNGGEDFELLFTVARENLNRLDQTGVNYYVVGNITDRPRERVLVTASEGRVPLQGGYDHFEKQGALQPERLR